MSDMSHMSHNDQDNLQGAHTDEASQSLQDTAGDGEVNKYTVINFDSYQKYFSEHFYTYEEDMGPGQLPRGGRVYSYSMIL